MILHHFPSATIYVCAVGMTGIIASATSLLQSPLGVAAVAFGAPIVPVLIGFLLTRSKLRSQDAKVQEIHVLVNSRLSKTLDALQLALVENIALKNRIGIPISDKELASATEVKAEIEKAAAANIPGAEIKI